MMVSEARLIVFSLLLACAAAAIVSHDDRAITIDGQRRILLSGSIHYPRSTAEMWPDLIEKAKDGGLDAIETYVFWNVHEPSRRQYNFDGNLDLVRFVKTVQEAGLYVVLRIGPYVCAEWNYGGFPIWLHNLPGVEFRTNNPVFMNEMQNFTTLIVDMMKKENLFASQGGPIILAQIENEYGNIESQYGDAGKEYVKWCASMANSLDIGVPWIMCQQDDAPPPMLSTCNGFYCDTWYPKNPNTPKMWTENWTGWFKKWGGKDPLRTAQDVAFAVARFFQARGVFQNYYMYHGGTNFGRTAGGPYITTTYDYDAPLDEYGLLNEPKWGHLKQLHAVLKSIEKTLTYGNVTDTDYGNYVSSTVYTTEDGSSCFLGNANDSYDATINFQGKNYHVPAWSVSILPDCKTEAFNTAKVNTQTTIKVKKSNNVDDQPESLEWSWRPENNDRALLLGKGEMSAHKLFDQKDIGDETSDYLWYMTNLHLKKNDPVLTSNMTMRINSNAHVLHAYINGQFVGTQYATDGKFHFTFERSVKLNPGLNRIALLSATVGLPNYGAFFDLDPIGITSPIEIVGFNGDERVIKDLSAHKWNYRVGLHGFEKKAHDFHSLAWSTESLPVNRSMTWYKTTFKAPLGSDPVVVDLIGLGKGMAWVNGNNLGRYWPSFKAPEDGCDAGVCDYRGAYSDSKCASNCGGSTQRWYHVPRSFLNNDGENTLVLFEEFGGNPSMVRFETVVPGTICGNAYENNTLELSCRGRPISDILFSSFGNPGGVCGSFAQGTCEGSNDAKAILSAECVGKETCSIDVSEDKFGALNCGGVAYDGAPKRLAVEAACQV